MRRSMLSSLGIHAGTLYDELNRTVDLNQFHAVHLENIDGDLAEIKRKLCQQLNYCRPPPFQTWGSRWLRALAGKASTGRTARAKRRQVLPAKMQLRVLQQYRGRFMARYWPDFTWFGYSEDPRHMDKAAKSQLQA